MMARALALVLLVVVVLVPAVWGADSPLVAELDEAARTYHVDPARLDRVREGLQKVAEGTPSLTELIPKMTAHMEKFAPAGADLKGWRY